jgi:hypothetical protein
MCFMNIGTIVEQHPCSVSEEQTVNLTFLDTPCKPSKQTSPVSRRACFLPPPHSRLSQPLSASVNDMSAAASTSSLFPVLSIDAAVYTASNTIQEIAVPFKRRGELVVYKVAPQLRYTI